MPAFFWYMRLLCANVNCAFCNVPGIMNWLIFTDKKTHMHTETLRAFFDSKKTAYSLVNAEEHDFVCAHENGAAYFENLYGKITEATHCVYFGTECVPQSPLFMYAAGLFSGKRIPVFSLCDALCDKAKSAVDRLHPDFTASFSDVNALIEYLKKNFPIYVKAEVQEKVRKKLFKSGIPLTPDSFSAYIARGDASTARLFFRAGMDVNVRDAAGTPMLSVAVRAANMPLVAWLLKQGADINAVSEDRGYTALMDAVWKDNYEIAEALVKAGADINTVAKDGQPLMVLAAGICNVEMCRLLFENGGDVFLKDRMGLSASDYAKVFKKQPLIDLFSSGGV